ncbi:hypothetical protein B5X24_HaOG204535 [Helicoverpa armigera]|uniref:Uncharacterized protein n=1 Tax=Helicoverpa armigera TaxID=29058 RepID=A0A2W1BXI0_HELAM|nr:hypothetical protein B5X24_HaOG204535 [Helicoverpa armigera]
MQRRAQGGRAMLAASDCAIVAVCLCCVHPLHGARRLTDMPWFVLYYLLLLLVNYIFKKLPAASESSQPLYRDSITTL